MKEKLAMAGRGVLQPTQVSPKTERRMFPDLLCPFLGFPNFLS
jgi:hypothetical protein